MADIFASEVIVTLDAELDLLSTGRMDRIVGLETEYGCLLSGGDAQGTSDAWPVKVKNYLFRKAQVGTIDLHYRDYEEPPGNGGFLLNGGRLYLDMGHIEYASPECLHLHDIVTYDLAGDELLQSALDRARRERIASASSKTMSIITPARLLVATRII